MDVYCIEWHSDLPSWLIQTCWTADATIEEGLTKSGKTEESDQEKKSKKRKEKDKEERKGKNSDQNIFMNSRVIWKYFTFFF